MIIFISYLVGPACKWHTKTWGESFFGWVPHVSKKRRGHLLFSSGLHESGRKGQGQKCQTHGLLTVKALLLDGNGTKGYFYKCS